MVPGTTSGTAAVIARSDDDCAVHAEEASHSRCIAAVRPAPRPQLSDRPAAAALAPDSDAALVIHRDDAAPEKKKHAELIVAKHRNGPTDTIRLSFEPALTQFRNAARDMGA